MTLDDICQEIRESDEFSWFFDHNQLRSQYAERGW